MADDTDRKRRNTIRGIGKGLKVIKTISNSLGTSPTETPDVDTKYEQAYNGTNRNYIIDKNGKGDLEPEPLKPKKPKAN